MGLLAVLLGVGLAGSCWWVAFAVPWAAWASQDDTGLWVVGLLLLLIVFIPVIAAVAAAIETAEEFAFILWQLGVEG